MLNARVKSTMKPFACYITAFLSLSFVIWLVLVSRLWTKKSVQYPSHHPCPSWLNLDLSQKTFLLKCLLPLGLWYKGCFLFVEFQMILFLQYILAMIILTKNKLKWKFTVISVSDFFWNFSLRFFDYNTYFDKCTYSLFFYGPNAFFMISLM